MLVSINSTPRAYMAGLREYTDYPYSNFVKFSSTY